MHAAVTKMVAALQATFDSRDYGVPPNLFSSAQAAVSAFLLAHPEWKEGLVRYGIASTIKVTTVIVLWQLRWIVVRPITNLYYYLFSSEFREIRKISGTYFMYHRPLIPELGDQIPDYGHKVRLSEIKIKVSKKGSSFRQYECIGPKMLGHAGTSVFRKEFIFTAADGVMQRYANIRKHITVYRPLTQDDVDDRFTTIGYMVGIANTNRIYSVNIILCKAMLRYEDAENALNLLEKEGVQIHVHKAVRARIKTVQVADKDTERLRYSTPFI